MKSFKLLFFLLSVSGSLYAQDLSVKDLTCEHKRNPIGIDARQPRFSWKITGTGNGIMQTAYSIRVSTDARFSSSKMVWQSGKTESEESVLIAYNGPELKSGQRYFWQVKVWDNKGRESKWSEIAFWETGLLPHQTGKQNGLKWKAIHCRYSPSPHFRKEFSLGQKCGKCKDLCNITWFL